MHLSEFQQKLNDLPVEQFYTKEVIGRNTAYIFEQKYGNNEESQKKSKEFKIMISEFLDIEYQNVAIVGSALHKFSLNPKKNFKEFSDISDIDIAIVSEKYFHEIWNALLQLESENPNSVPRKIKNNFFWKFTNLNGIKYQNKTTTLWAKKVDSFKKDFIYHFEIDQEINYRIYKDWEDVRRYHCWGIKNIQNNIIRK